MIGEGDLTTTELGILQDLLELDDDRQAVARKRYVSVRTVHKHLENGRRKLGVSSTAALISKALKLRMIEVRGGTEDTR